MNFHRRGTVTDHAATVKHFQNYRKSVSPQRVISFPPTSSSVVDDRPQRPIEDGLGAQLTMFEPISGSNASTVIVPVAGAVVVVVGCSSPRCTQLQAVTCGEQVDFQAT
jgi:hypothetical protein